MFNRAYIKQMAKTRMSGWMGNAILVGLIALLLGGIGNGVSYRFNYNHSLNYNDFSDGFAHLWSNYLSILMPLFAVGGLIAITYAFLVANVIKIGMRGWFMRYWRGEYPSVGELFAGFKIYGPSVTTALLRDVFVFLWSLLFIIPGIVMHYAYSMTDYIIYENPNLPATRAIEMSKIMTQGFKGELFIFDLSYIGWYLLTACTCGILGIVYVNPYMYTAHAGIYETLKSSALQRGILAPADFGMAPPPPPPAYGGYSQGTY